MLFANKEMALARVRVLLTIMEIHMKVVDRNAFLVPTVPQTKPASETNAKILVPVSVDNLLNVLLSITCQLALAIQAMLVIHSRLVERNLRQVCTKTIF